MKHLFIFIFLLLFSLTGWAQDVHLTQYYTSNLSLNPAYTGNYYGDVRAVVNSRSQWGQVSTPIRTNMFSIEKKIHRFPDEIGIGMIVINDQVSAYHLNTNKVLVSAAYQKDIKKNYIRLGLQGGMVFRSLDVNDQTFPEQWNYSQGVFDPSLPNRPSNLQSSYNFADISAGASWTRRIGAANITAGYGVFHLNHPKDQFTSATRKQPFRHVFNASAIYSLSKKTSLIPHLLYMRTVKASDFVVGANGRYMVKEELGVVLGAGYRGSAINSDAALAVAGFIYKRLQIGFSMDFNVSELSKDAKNKTAWEFSIIYTTPSRIPGKVTLPCDRY